MQFIVEHAQGAVQAFDGHRGGNIGDLRQILQVSDGQAQHAEHAVGAVDQRQAFFFFQLERGDAGVGKRGRGRHRFFGARNAHLPLPQQRQRAV